MRQESKKVPVQALQSPADVARRLGMSRSNIYHLATVGAIPSIKFGKAVRFDPRDVDRFIRDHRRKTA